MVGPIKKTIWRKTLPNSCLSALWKCSTAIVYVSYFKLYIHKFKFILFIYFIINMKINNILIKFKNSYLCIISYIKQIRIMFNSYYFILINCVFISCFELLDILINNNSNQTQKWESPQWPSSPMVLNVLLQKILNNISDITLKHITCYNFLVLQLDSVPSMSHLRLSHCASTPLAIKKV